jgi:large subunit ribosomal protein L3
MKKAIIGRKLGMTQIFDESGLMIPVTIVKAGPMTVLRKKIEERDGYKALVCAYEDISERRLNKPKLGVFKKAGISPKRIIKEFKLEGDYEIGSTISCDIFQKGDMVDVIGTSKGRGFSGVIKRWNQARIGTSHGTGPVHRSLGSTGASATPGKVRKGLKMAGQYGNERVTIQNLKVEKVYPEQNVLLIRGGLPGPKGGLLTVREAVKK